MRWNQENNILSVDEEGQEELLFSADGIADDDLFVEKLEEALS